jgi:hypothetical protein
MVVHTIQVIDFDGKIIDESQPIVMLMVWRANVNNFFDVITVHINHNRWE